MTLFKIWLISAILVFITDISGFIENGIEPLLARILKVQKVKLKKPWNCSLCQSVWVGLIYILCIEKFTIPMMAYVLLIAFLTPVTFNILMDVRDILLWITNPKGK